MQRADMSRREPDVSADVHLRRARGHLTTRADTGGVGARWLQRDNLGATQARRALLARVRKIPMGVAEEVAVTRRSRSGAASRDAPRGRQLRHEGCTVNPTCAQRTDERLVKCGYTRDPRRVGHGNEPPKSDASDLLIVERLQIANMVQVRSSLARRILDAGWGRLVEMLRYKLAWRGGRLIKLRRPTARKPARRAGMSTPAPAGRRSFVAEVVATPTMLTSMPPKF